MIGPTLLRSVPPTGHTHRRLGTRVPHLLGTLAVLVAAALPMEAQVLEGSVRGDDGVAVAGALIALYDPDGEQRAATLSDARGFYRLEAPEPGEYTLGVERIGFVPFRSHLLAVGDRVAAYPVDVTVERSPFPLEGLVVTADRREEIRRQLRLVLGHDPRSLRHEIILRDEIEAHLERGRDIPSMLQWSNIPGLIVKEMDEGHCFEVRGGCLPLYLNGMRLDVAWSEMVPLAVADAVVILSPLESIRYEGGAILLFTQGWLR